MQIKIKIKIKMKIWPKQEQMLYAKYVAIFVVLLQKNVNQKNDTKIQIKENQQHKKQQRQQKQKQN